MKTVIKYYEVPDMHPRAAAWLRNRGLVYIHEYPARYGRMDFLAIDPVTGQISIVECKVNITSAADVLSQIDGYRNGVSFPQGVNVNRIGLSLMPVSKKVIIDFVVAKAEVYGLRVSYPFIQIERYTAAYIAFNTVYRQFYGADLPNQYALMHQRARMRRHRNLVPSFDMSKLKGGL